MLELGNDLFQISKTCPFGDKALYLIIRLTLKPKIPPSFGKACLKLGWKQDFSKRICFNKFGGTLEQL